MKRRIARVAFTPEILGLMMETDGKAWVCVSGLPPGSKYLGVYLDEERLCVFMTYEHESFPEVSAGEVVPLLPPPVFKRIYE